MRASFYGQREHNYEKWGLHSMVQNVLRSSFFSKTFPFIFPQKWTNHQGPPLLSDHLSLIFRVVLKKEVPLYPNHNCFSKRTTTLTGFSSPTRSHAAFCSFCLMLGSSDFMSPRTASTRDLASCRSVSNVNHSSWGWDRSRTRNRVVCLRQREREKRVFTDWQEDSLQMPVAVTPEWATAFGARAAL